MFVYNNFDATIPTMDLGEEDKNFIALINRELKSYIDNNERMRWVCCCKKRTSHLAVQYDSFMSFLVVVLCLNWEGYSVFIQTYLDERTTALAK